MRNFSFASLLLLLSATSFAQNCSSQRDYDFGVKNGLKMAPPCSQSAPVKPAFIQGVEYRWSEGACTNSESSRCITIQEFKQLCEKQSGATKIAMATWFVANSAAMNLYQNGDLNVFRVSWDGASKSKCVAHAELQGIVNGSSKRVTVEGKVGSFIVTSDGQIAIKSIYEAY